MILSFSGGLIYEETGSLSKSLLVLSLRNDDSIGWPTGKSGFLNSAVSLVTHLSICVFKGGPYHFSMRSLHVQLFILPPTRVISTCFWPWKASKNHNSVATTRAKATGAAIGVENMSFMGYSLTIPFASTTFEIFCLNCANGRMGRFSGDSDNTYATSAQRSRSLSKLSKYEGIGVPLSPPLKVR